MEVRQAEEEIFETPDLGDEGEGTGPSAAALRLSRGLYQEREADPESLVPTSIDADSAFEFFHGKVYNANGMGTSFYQDYCTNPRPCRTIHGHAA